MKYLKTFENLNLLTEWGLILSEEDFNKYADEFDSIVEPFLEYADAGYGVSFETAYGSKVTMTYDDYNKKNDKYKEFINGLPARRLFFSSRVEMLYDYKVLLSLLEDVQVSVDRLGDLGWKMKEFQVHGLKDVDLSWIKPRIIISHEFEKRGQI
jgi:hypothetical protein